MAASKLFTPSGSASGDMRKESWRRGTEEAKKEPGFQEAIPLKLLVKSAGGPLASSPESQRPMVILWVMLRLIFSLC